MRNFRALFDTILSQQIRINLKLARRWQHYVYRIVVIMGVVSLGTIKFTYKERGQGTAEGDLSYAKEPW